ncbi:type II secretory pathway pseudopilin PulG [Salibacterium salarium]|uniref:prepilin-type N-terminal cleavage/methylation domain-containing protein n=1 Tax=Salibacterium salarium TaxID=284579 RepID=UPI002780886C|nr:prepilin-type N-terminal cleavage/methylation domain-containing protein [Salibacterium salarium]MDQ0299612.1 type II secretory pathway pseudopilin PulG [Salibacterium salarium]
MKNFEKGMTLIEAVVALSLLSLLCVLFIPMYSVVINEQKSIFQERRAMYLLEKEALLLQQHVSSIETGQTEGKYTWTISNNKNGVDLCLNWKGDNNRPYEKCLFVLPK